MASLRATIDSLADEFTRKVLAALRAASLDALAAHGSARARPPPPRRAARASPGGSTRRRRSPEELGWLADKIVLLVRKQPKGIRAEDLKRAMGVPPGNVGAKAFTKPLSIALASGRIRKRGARRATFYFAP